MVFKWFLNGFLNGLFGPLIVASRTSSYLQRSVPIQPKTSNILPKFCRPSSSAPPSATPARLRASRVPSGSGPGSSPCPSRSSRSSIASRGTLAWVYRYFSYRCKGISNTGIPILVRNLILSFPYWYFPTCQSKYPNFLNFLDILTFFLQIVANALTYRNYLLFPAMPANARETSDEFVEKYT